jgi:hypothetical protein
LLPVFLLTFNPTSFDSVAKEYLHAMNVCTNKTKTLLNTFENGESNADDSLLVNMNEENTSEIDFERRFKRQTIPDVELEGSIGDISVEFRLNDSEQFFSSRATERESDIEMTNLI